MKKLTRDNSEYGFNHRNDGLAQSLGISDKEKDMMDAELMKRIEEFELGDDTYSMLYEKMIDFLTNHYNIDIKHDKKLINLSASLILMGFNIGTAIERSHLQRKMKSMLLDKLISGSGDLSKGLLGLLSTSGGMPVAESPEVEFDQDVDDIEDTVSNKIIDDDRDDIF